MMLICSFSFTALALAFSAAESSAQTAPTVTVANGTYQGFYQSFYDQDIFLGIPYAQPPVGPLRLAPPQSLNESFTSIKRVTEYSLICPGNNITVGADDWDHPIGEDCLTLNVIKPSGFEGQQLPVGFWIYGGGFGDGSSADERYNLSYIVKVSADIGLPIMGVSINYRVNGFGFLDSSVMRQAGLSNLGLRDQRLALEWVQENIEAFGGDKTKVTIWGQSAGAASVGNQLLAFNGDNGGLFRGAIAESGGILMSPGPSIANSNSAYANITATLGCPSLGMASLECLRSANFSALLEAILTAPGAQYSPVIDGDFVPTQSSVQLRDGKFSRVPLLIGSNTDEGTSAGQRGLPVNNETTLVANMLTTGVTEAQIPFLLALYPDIPAIASPFVFHGREPANGTFGSMFKRQAGMIGDFQTHRGRRISAISWANYSVPVYSYRYNVWPTFNLSITLGATHFQEVSFVFNNTQGLGFQVPYNFGNPLQGLPSKYNELQLLMSSMWISFIHDGNPNNHGIGSYDGYDIPQWPVYASNPLDAVQGYGQNLVFDINVTSIVVPENDTWRAEAIAYQLSDEFQAVVGT